MLYDSQMTNAFASNSCFYHATLVVSDNAPSGAITVELTDLIQDLHWQNKWHTWKCGSKARNYSRRDLEQIEQWYVETHVDNNKQQR